jgi:LytS/YehU family sensor histidine kinase
LKRARVLNKLGDLSGSLLAFENSIRIGDSVAEVDSKEAAKEKMLEYEAAINRKEAERISKETQIQMARVQQERYLFWGVLVCSLVLAVVIYRFARLRLNETRLEADRASVEMKLFSLRSQINPEFVTGCFDALAELVTGGEQKQVRAKAFVGELSAYYRNVLVIADKGVHSLDEELEFSGLFLDLQRNLSGEKIRGSIEVQDDLDTTSIQVPAMLLHPFLDNLIRFGAPGNSGEQEVSVSVYYEKDGPGIRMTGHVLEDVTIEKVVQGHGAVLMRQRLEQLSGKERDGVIRFGSDEGSRGKIFVDLQLPVESG